jgi:hypothetical protein
MELSEVHRSGLDANHGARHESGSDYCTPLRIESSDNGRPLVGGSCHYSSRRISISISHMRNFCTLPLEVSGNALTKRMY